MATSHQRGYVTLRGKQWYGYYRKEVNDPTTGEPKTVRVPIILGLKTKMSKFEPPGGSTTRAHETSRAARLPYQNHE